MRETTSDHPDPNPPSTPADIVTTLLVTLLAPLFLRGGDGAISLARMAAQQTLSAYRARSLADLLLAANVIAFSLGAIGSLGLAVTDDITLPMTLRLRGNANSLNRSAEQNRRALAQHPAAQATPIPANPIAPPPHEPIPPPNPAEEAALIASVAATQQAAAEARARLQATARSAPAQTISAQPVATRPAVAQPAVTQLAVTQPAVTQAVPPKQPTLHADTTHPATAPHVGPGHPTATVQGREHSRHQLHQTLWAKAMADVAAEFTASLAQLPPEQRHATATRAAALTRTANSLLAGNIPPADMPFTLNHPNRPGI